MSRAHPKTQPSTISFVDDVLFFFSKGAPVKRRRAEARALGERGPGSKKLKSAIPNISAQNKKKRRPPKKFTSTRFASLLDVSSVLSKFSLTIETRYFSGAKTGITYLKDLIFDTATPAAFAGANTATRVTPPKPINPAVLAYRDALRISHQGRQPSYSGWIGIKTGLPASLSRKVNLAYVVSKNIGYIGRPGSDAYSPLECLDNREKTVARLYGYLSQIAEKHGRTPPPLEQFMAMPEGEQNAFLEKYFVFDEWFTTGTPVLFRDANLVRAVDVSPFLSAKHLSESYGQTMSEFWAENNPKALAKKRIIEATQEIVLKARMPEPTQPSFGL